MNQKFILVIIVILVIGVGALAPMWLSPFLTRVLQLFFFSAALASAWNILGGYAGYWSFGHTVFIGVGAFSAAHYVANVGTFGAPSLAIVPPILVGGIVSGVLAAVIAYPFLRLRGIYFAIAMLAFSQVLAELVNNIDWFEGGIGVSVPAELPEGMAPERFYYYVFGLLFLLCLGISAWIRKSKLGYGLISIREDEDTAGMLGVPAEHYKIITFVISATLIGMLGAVYAHSVGHLTTYTVFRIDFSLNMIVHTLIGGIGTLFGPVVGAGVMLLITHVLLSRLLDVHMLVTGLIVVAIVLLMPGGILSVVTKRLSPRRPRTVRSATRGQADGDV